jgi:hypothetical protein
MTKLTVGSRVGEPGRRLCCLNLPIGRRAALVVNSPLQFEPEKGDYLLRCHRLEVLT